MSNVSPDYKQKPVEKLARKQQHSYVEEIPFFKIIDIAEQLPSHCTYLNLINNNILKGTHARDFIVSFSQFFGIIQ